jgi:hypothetical protein
MWDISMNFVVYYMLILHINIISNIPTLFYIDFGIFHQVPLFFLTQNMKTFFAYFLSYRNLEDSKRTPVFATSVFMEEKELNAKKYHTTRPPS